MAYIGTKPTVGNFQICDAISVVNGQAAYTMQVGSVNVIPQSANHMIVSLNGTIQKPNSSFTVSGSTITFASNLATGDVIDFIQILGDVLDLGVPSDATVTTAKLADSAVTAAKITDSTITAAKLADDAVTAAKLNNDIISGSTELASEPADTDEFLVSDAGTIKRIDYSLIKGGGNTVLLHSNVLSSNSGNAGVNINGFFTTDYKIYKLYVYNFSLTGGVNASVQILSGGSRQSSNYRFIGNAAKNEYSTVNQASHGGWGSSSINLSPSGTDWGGGASGRSYIEVTMYDPLNTSYYKTLDILIGNNSNNNAVWSDKIFAEWRDTSAVTGIGVFGNSNTAIYSGTEFKLYGIKT